MLRKSLHVSIAICLLVAVIMPASVAFAQQPLPPSTPPTGQVPPVDPVTNGGPLPEVVQKAAQLQQSLSPSQQAAIRAALDQYQPELMEIAAADMARHPDVPAATGLQSPATDTNQPEAKRMDGNQAARMTAVLNKIDASMAAILNADQLNLFRAVMNPASANVPAISQLAVPNSQSAVPNPASKPDSGNAPSSYTSSCFYAPYYGSYARYYERIGYSWAVVNYFYWGTTYAYNAYYYAYYGLTYGYQALNLSAPLYFYFNYVGTYDSGDTYYSYIYNNDADYFEYYGYYYANLDYSNTSHTYAYYAAYYLNYGQIYSYNAYYYAYYCWYYS